VFFDVVWNTDRDIPDIRFLKICALVGLCDKVAINLSTVNYDR